MPESAPRPAGEQIELAGSRAAHAFTSGIRGSLRNNASAYGFSVTLTISFALVSASHPHTERAVPILMFAAAAVVTFFLLEALASRLFQQVEVTEADRVTFVSGAVDGLAVLSATGTAAGLAEVPGVAAWPVTAGGAVLVFLLVGGIDILLARRMARRVSSD